MTFDQYSRESFCEYVSCLILSRHVKDLEFLSSYELANPEVAVVDVLHATMMFGIVHCSDSRLVVHVEKKRSGLVDVEMKFLE